MLKFKNIFILYKNINCLRKNYLKNLFLNYIIRLFLKKQQVVKCIRKKSITFIKNTII